MPANGGTSIGRQFTGPTSPTNGGGGIGSDIT
jgi:hypothetical protein